MNMNTPHQPRRDLHELLRELPSPDLPPALWQRVRGRQRAIHRNRLLGAASALTIAVVAGGFLGWMPPNPDAGRQAGALVQSPASDTDADIRAIDSALQTAYAQGLSDADISPLWRERERLMSIRNAGKVERAPRGGQA